ncbi:copper resistance protein CopB [Pseudomonas sp. SDI]|uniref:copper resistance protein B n=1 Tax=Pseudomonas sp. SDI TaxID=2170734 RepID=UPI000DE71251|nr:copper resistance protein B [Pseudomonas sp. SDI]PWB31832.1 copper resistance protein CopB [Pseudomonas sp. SDI]
MTERLNRPLLGSLALLALLGSEEARAAEARALNGHQVHDRQVNWAVIVEQLEVQQFDSSSALNWNANAWIGGDIDRLWLRSEGEREQGRTHKAELQALWGHAISPWWELVGGLRQDFKPASGQAWAAVGIQGTPLYGLELEATAYAGERQQTALRLEASYAILLSNRWILEPTLESNVYGRTEPQREQGAGLADSELGLRLRYEISRGFAPYLGVSFNRLHGRTAELARDADDDTGQTRVVAGIRLRF